MDKKLGRRAILVVTAFLALGSAGAWGQGGGGRGVPRDRDEMMMQRRERLREFRDDMRRQEQERLQRRRVDVMPPDARPEPAQALQPGGWRDGNGGGPRGPGGQFQNGAKRGEQLRHLSPEERQQLREQMRDAAREVYGQ